jgi:hypothetical protein
MDSWLESVDGTAPAEESIVDVMADLVIHGQ